jgi:regulator of protease activity HflC (stomatin/prohibitin superfamily)
MSDVWTSGTKMFCGWTTDIYKYDIGTQKITFDTKGDNKDAEYDRIEINCGENGGQKAWIAISMNYRIGYDTAPDGHPVLASDKLVTLHKEGLRETYESVILKRTIVEIVNKVARPHKALDIYSGQGFVNFVESLEKELKNCDILRERGIYVENIIVYSVHLDPKYEAEIAAKQLAIQETLKIREQTIAKQEEAKRIFAESQANVEKVRQDSEASKIQMVKNAEAENEKAILTAQAEKQKRVLEAEGQRDANLAMASGKLAIGKAEAEVEQLKRDAMYAGEAGSRRASVEIAGLQADKLKGMLTGVSVISDKALYNMGKSTGMYTVGVGNDDK